MKSTNAGVGSLLMLIAALIFIGTGVEIIFGSGIGFLTLGVLCFIIALIWAGGI